MWSRSGGESKSAFTESERSFGVSRNCAMNRSAGLLCAGPMKWTAGEQSEMQAGCQTLRQSARSVLECDHHCVCEKCCVSAQGRRSLVKNWTLGSTMALKHRWSV